MAENKKSFVLYSDQKELFEMLPDESAGKLIKHIFQYVNDESPKTDDQLVKIAFASIRQQLKRDLERWKQITEERSASGTVGNLKRWHKDTYKKFVSGELTLEESLEIAKSRTAIKPIANIAVNDTVNVIDKENIKRNFFTPPTEEDITAFFLSKASTKVEADKFRNFYESKGWMVGKNKMQKWKNSASGWIARNSPIKKTDKEELMDMVSNII